MVPGIFRPSLLFCSVMVNIIPGPSVSYTQAPTFDGLQPVLYGRHCGQETP